MSADVSVEWVPYKVIPQDDQSGFDVVLHGERLTDPMPEAVAAVLEGEGYRVVEATHGAEALRHLRSSTLVCMILLDLWMPVMNGFEFRAELEADPHFANIPIIIITGAGVLVDERAGTLRAEVLRKPFDLKALLTTVKRFCPSPMASA